MQGNLAEMSLVDLIQVNCLERRRARLALRSGDRRGELYFDGGEVVHATDGTCQGRDALFALLAWTDGAFELVPNVPPPRQSLDDTWSGLLLEGMRRIDEGRRHGNGHPPSTPAPPRPPARPAPATSSGHVVSLGETARVVTHRLAAIQGVTGALLVDPDGTVLARAVDGDADHLGAIAVFLASAADRLGRALTLDRFERAVVTLPAGRLLILPAGDGLYAGLLLDDRASPEILRPAIDRALGRDQSRDQGRNERTAGTPPGSHGEDR